MSSSLGPRQSDGRGETLFGPGDKKNCLREMEQAGRE